MELASEITPEELGDAYVVDIRPKLEVKGEPPQREVPIVARESKLPEIAERLDGKPLVLMCRTGRRSLEATMRLRAAGHANVCSLKGGVRAFNAYLTDQGE
ncbi:MAG: rhodanese-like domain-containing protein [Fimbriimonadaceae bacterium]